MRTRILSLPSKSIFPSLRCCYSVNNNPVDEKTSESKFSVILSQITSSRGLVITGSILAALGITRAMYNITYSFLSLTPATSMYYGFLGGVMVSTTTAALIYIGDRSFRINPNRALAASLKILNKNSDLKHLIGSSLSAGPIKVYQSRETFLRPQIQMCYLLQGAKGEALVSVVYCKKGLGEDIEYLGVDWMDKAGKILDFQLIGDPSKFNIKTLTAAFSNNLKKFL